MILQDQVKIFCYSGLIPFILIPIISWISPKIAFDYYLILFFFTWSIMMATFMAGTLWGLSIKSNESILSSIIIFSSDVEEIHGLADRFMVLNRGTVKSIYDQSVQVEQLMAAAGENINTNLN